MINPGMLVALRIEFGGQEDVPLESQPGAAKFRIRHCRLAGLSSVAVNSIISDRYWRARKGLMVTIHTDRR